MCIQRRFESTHDLGGLHRVAARPDIEIQIRKRQPEVGEELPAHALVVMLSGVHQQRGQRRDVTRQRAQDRRHFHEIGPGTDHAHHWRHGAFSRTLTHLLLSSDVVLTAPTSFCKSPMSCTFCRSSLRRLRSTRCS